MKTITGKVDAMVYVEENGYPEVGAFAEKKDIQKFYKQLPTEFLEDWAEQKDLEYKPCDNDSIHRMRVAMAILELHFPSEKKGTSAKSKYSSFTDEDLLKLCVEHGVAVEESTHKGIMRMRMVQALRANKVIE